MPNIFQEKEVIIQYFSERGLLIAPDALNTMLRESLGSYVLELISEDSIASGYVTENIVIEAIRKQHTVKAPEYEVDFANVRINSSVDDFRNYFRSRYEKVKRLITLSISMRGTTSIKSAKRLMNGEVKIVGMVQDQNVTVNGNRRLVVEDLEDSITVILMKRNGLAGEVILLDEVIGIVGGISTKDKDPVIFAREIIRPDIPAGSIREYSGEPAIVGSISDIHVGSKTFLGDSFKKMISWIKSGGEETSSLKYLVLSGDVVDGIGVYPSQERDLEIQNPFEQYLRLNDYISEIPEEIKVFIMPGNHDIVRLAEPQPVLPERLRKEFSSNVTFLPNPFNLQLEGRRVLLYHGMSLNDIVELVPGMNFDTIGRAVEEILRRRHLAPRYGGKTPLIPAPEDYHVIEEVPDIFITGHVHSHAMGNYRGVRYVNSSTWQSQTDYQKMMNFSPNPCMLTLFDLNSSNYFAKDFK
ncbi:MAG: DNA-directed DNA polymerase II small subunit [Candidatus Thermoplasmatota archaeon]|nr:DNA-directed DNA polymerase II small subunit [Candidatus Thermoplasmatota archaeon]MCL5438171.1 DNA-directed DNA polymerase II small subunit [Candidatus Thermoplasmatota archaeon]